MRVGESMIGGSVTVCKCGHREDQHGPQLRNAPHGRYSRDDLCCHVAPLGTMSVTDVINDCGCDGWEPKI